jgi:hypothetical protein
VTAGGREWHAAFHVMPVAASTYLVRCEGPNATFALGGETVKAGQGRAAMALLVLPLVGLVTAAITTILVLARRRAAQDRLFAAWTGKAGQR